MTLSAKQEAFALAYLETGNASEAYRRAYNASKMQPGTVNREATRLLANPLITTRIAELQATAASKAVLSRAWVLEGLMYNARVALGREKVTLVREVKGKKEGERTDVVTIEVTDRDAAAANRALELLGRTDEVALFVERHEHTGKGGGPIVTQEEPLADIDRARRIVFILREAEKNMTEKTDSP
jgi:Terminase small subunit